MYGAWSNVTGIYAPLGVNISDNLQYSRTLSSTMEALIDEATSANNNGSVLGFSTKEAVAGDGETIYGLAQCTPDIVGVDCNECLSNAFSLLQSAYNAYEGAEYATFNCLLIYNNQMFYDLS